MRFLIFKVITIDIDITIQRFSLTFKCKNVYRPWCGLCLKANAYEIMVSA